MNRDLSEATNEIVSDERNVRIAVAQNQAEFPYDREDESQVTRREFCNFLFLTSSALLAGAGGFAGKALYDSRSSRSFAPAKIDGGESLKHGSSLNFFIRARMTRRSLFEQLTENIMPSSRNVRI
jgi:hypothetical protein